MTLSAAVRLGLWPLAVTGLAALGWAALAPITQAALPAPVRLEQADTGPTVPYPADSLAARVEGTDPFRLGHRPAPVKYDPQASAAPPAGYTPPRAPLRLVGLVGGPPPLAALSGLPGIEGDRLLGVGQQVGGFRVVSIDGGRVRVAGQDTVWVLTLRQQ